MNRKPHPSAVLKHLPPEDQEALFEFLRSKGPDGKGRSLADGVKWLFSNNGVRTNDSSLSEWRGWYQLQHDIAGHNALVDDVARELAARQVNPDLIRQLSETVFLFKAAKEGDAKTFAAVAALVQRDAELKAQKQAHDDKMNLEDKKLKRKDRSLDQAEKKLAQAERKIAALEKQAEAAKRAAEKAKDAIKSGGMDDETRAKLMAEMDRMILGTKAADAMNKKEAA